MEAAATAPAVVVLLAGDAVVSKAVVVTTPVATSVVRAVVEAVLREAVVVLSPAKLRLRKLGVMQRRIVTVNSNDLAHSNVLASPSGSPTFPIFNLFL